MKKLLIFVAFVALSAAAQAQLWNGVIASSRAINWANVGPSGGIPNRTIVCATIAPEGSSGGYVTQTDINAAIASCPSGEVVQLQAGNFYLANGIDFAQHSNVTVRGAGADQTFIYVNNGTSCDGIGAAVCMAGSNSGVDSEQNVCDWTAGYTVGTTVITLANCGTTTPAVGSLSNLVVGSVLVLDQVDQASDNGTIWNCVALNACANTGNGGEARTDGPAVGGVTARSQQQAVTVTAINGSSITISPAIYMPNWTSAQAPQAWFATTTIVADSAENFSLDDSAAPTSGNGTHNFLMFNCDGCWVSGVRSLYASRSHVDAQDCARCAVVNSYFYENKTHASVSYGIEGNTASDFLVQNNAFDSTTDSTPNCNGGCEGNVYAYNYMVGSNYGTADWFQAGMYEHASGDAMMLWEGNVESGFTSDNVHGTHFFNTLFRNWLIGNQNGCYTAPCSAQTIPVQMYAASRYFNVIGNVLGDPGYHTSYTCAATTSASCGSANVSIYALGYTGNGGGVNTSIVGFCTNPPTCSTFGDYDPMTSESLYRWGNYDVQTAAVRWCGNSSDPGWSTTCASTSEIPTTLASYAQTVPSSTTLPASFYLSAQPSWWATKYGTPPWPAIGPDVSAGPGPGGFAYQIPAELCFLNQPFDTAYTSGNTQSITSITESGSAATITLSGTPPASFTAGAHVWITGNSVAGYNTWGAIQSVSGNTIVISVLTSGLATGSGGTMTAKAVRIFSASTCYGTASNRVPSFRFGRGYLIAANEKNVELSRKSVMRTDANRVESERVKLRRAIFDHGIDHQRRPFVVLHGVQFGLNRNDAIEDSTRPANHARIIALRIGF